MLSKSLSDVLLVIANQVKYTMSLEYKLGIYIHLLLTFQAGRFHACSANIAVVEWAIWQQSLFVSCGFITTEHLGLFCVFVREGSLGQGFETSRSRNSANWKRKMASEFDLRARLFLSKWVTCLSKRQ
jgi:hypothetical protein